MDTVHRILTFVTCMTRLCLQSLHHHFVAWSKPDTTSLLLLTLTDLPGASPNRWQKTRGSRQQVIILRRQVKGPACTKGNRMLLVLLARMVQTWKKALFSVQEDDAPAMASPRLQTLLEIQVEGTFSHAKDIAGGRELHQANGQRQPTVGSRAH